jgi:hypothetical protein
LHYLSAISRSTRAGFARWLLAALCVTAGGCQNNAANDLIARDRRMQEDQIYMLQDYVKQYQGLVCRYRSENASLRQQLSEGYPVEQPRDELQTPRSRENSVIKNTPQFQAPQSPANNDRSTEPATPTPRAPVETPEVPPLKTSAANESPATTGIATGNAAAHRAIEPQVVAASYEEPTIESSPAAESSQASAEVVAAPIATDGVPQTAVNEQQQNGKAPADRELVVSGEILANESGGGPRLRIDLSPQLPPGAIDATRGSVSLMLVVPRPNGGRQTLGRWDFGPNEVQAAVVDPNTIPLVVRFFIELPAEAQIDPAAQLWARVLPRRGMKLLTHANVDLTSVGTFSSAPQAVATDMSASTETVSQASYTEESASTTETPASNIAPAMNEGKWVTAEPGKPANLPAEARDTTGGGGWRTSSEPMPAAVVNADNGSHKDRMAKLRDEVRASRAAEARAEADKQHSHDKPQPTDRPAWSSNRLSGPNRVAERPSWSATR